MKMFTKENNRNHNQRVIDSYNHGALYDNIYDDKYDDMPPTRREWEDKWFHQVFNNLNSSSKIFEFGSGYGEDAVYLQKMGYKVEVSEAAPALVEYLIHIGFDEARDFNALTDEFPCNYDLILATGVLHQFNTQQFEVVVSKIFEALPEGGRFAFHLMEGEGEDIIDDIKYFYHYTHFWEQDKLTQILEKIGFESIIIDKIYEYPCGVEIIRLAVIAEKISAKII